MTPCLEVRVLERLLEICLMYSERKREPMLIFKMRPGGKRARPTSIAACAVLIFMTASGCAGSAGDSAEQTSIAIARQVGLGYAPLVILENKPELVEQYLPGVKIDWNEIGAGTSIRDAVLAGDIDVAAGGAGPVIVGITKGMEISILSGIAEMPMWVVAAPGGPQNLDDFDETDKFATAGLGSSQHVLLNSALDEAGLEPKALEENLVSMGHPDGLSAFLAGQVAAHATSSPFQEREVAAGGIKIVDSFDIWGEHTFQLTYMQRQWVEENPELADGLTEAISAAIDWIETTSLRRPKFFLTLREAEPRLKRRWSS